MTIKDIAKKAGVSMMTVSNVINQKHNRVSPKTIEKVNAIIRESNYTPNLNARSLSNKSSKIIGIIISIEDTDSDINYFNNPYISTMIGVIEQELRHHGYFTMIRTVVSPSDIMKLLGGWGVDGILFLLHTNSNVEAFLENSSCPTAIFDSQLTLPKVINVSSHDENGLYLSTSHLIACGHKHIAFLADYEGNPIFTKRFSGYCKALAEHNIPLRPEYLLKYPVSYEGGIEAVKELATRNLPITGLVTVADICATGVLEGARLCAISVPDDLSVIGYDNLSICQFTYPKLTSVSQDITQKAVMATKLLLERIESGKMPKKSHVTLDVTLVERESVRKIEN